jgi:medium-chain acyl-[acyl-carrier-protein] hydrolase
MQEITKDKLISISKFKITSADTDIFARLRLGGMVNYLIQAAIDSADKLGFGFSGLREQKLFWVLNRLTIEMPENLGWYDEIEVETWPKTVDRILYLRDYLVRNTKNQIVAKATSGWAAIDVETKKLKQVSGVEAEIFSHLKDKQALTDFEKLDRVKEGDNFEVKTSFFDIDLNKHVTSTRYVDWMMDTFSLDFHRDNRPKTLTINYMKETMPGDEILLSRHSPDGKKFYFEGFNKSKETIACRAVIGF